MIEFLSQNQIVALFVIISIGVFIGQLSVRGVSLGASAVLFVAMAFGHYGVLLPGAISSLGVILFVYAVGLQAGPKFFKSFRRRGLSFAFLALATLLAGFVAAWACEMVFGFGPALTSGLYAGSMTTTPGLAAALGALKDPNVSVGYGMAYPMGVVGVVLFVQVFPRLLKVDLKSEARKIDAISKGPGVEWAWLEVKNPQLHEITVAEFTRMQLTTTEISRITKLGRTIPARSDAVLQLGDRVRAIGTAEELSRLELLIGPRVEGVVEPPSQIESRTLVVTEEAVVGKSLSQLAIRERYGVVITRLWREDMESVPTGRTTLEFGDTIRIVGDHDDCERFIPLVGHQERKLQETEFLPLSVGLMLGVLVGLIAVPMPGGLSLTLGMAGGPLLVALLAGHFGRLGPMSFRVPLAAKYFIRELGLIFFLAASGSKAGEHFVEVFKVHGPALLLASAIVTLVPVAVCYGLARRFLKIDILSSLGLTCGCMTSTPGLGVATAASDSETPGVAYATVYPMALIMVTLLSQGLALGLKLMAGN